MRVVSWNIQKRSGKRLDGIIAAFRSVKPDLVLLQAATRASLDLLLPPLHVLGLQHVLTLAGEAERQGKYAANALMSRWPVTAAEPGWARAAIANDPALGAYRKLFPGWDGAAPRPWMLLRAKVATPGGAIDVINAHVPAGTELGVDKVKGFVVLADVLARAPAGPRLIGGDLSSPKLETERGVIGFGGGKGRSPLWRKAEETFFHALPRLGLRDVYRAHHGYEAERTRDAYSFLAGAAKRRFDHLFASSELRTDTVEYRTDWLHAELSDHAALLASLSWAGNVVA